MTRWHWLFVLGLVATPFAACGPDHRPDEPCNGPSFNLVVKAESGPLPADTRINVRYGGNQDGEPYALGQTVTAQAVFCHEDTTIGGAPSNGGDPTSNASGDGGAPGAAPTTDGVQALRCDLYTQGPARLDVTATGYESIDGQDLSFEGKKRCEVPIEVTLVPKKLDAGK